MMLATIPTDKLIGSPTSTTSSAFIPNMTLVVMPSNAIKQASAFDLGVCALTHAHAKVAATKMVVETAKSMNMASSGGVGKFLMVSGMRFVAAPMIYFNMSVGCGHSQCVFATHFQHVCAWFEQLHGFIQQEKSASHCKC